MKVGRPANLALITLAAVMLSVVVGACGDGSEPEDRRFDLRIEAGVLNLEGPMKVKQGDEVTLNVDADEDGSFHLHGYDIEIDVGAGGTSVMQFTANATGDFPITFHPGVVASDEEEEGHDEHDDEEEEDDDEEEEHHDEGGEEIIIGSLEVGPR